jgi:hypothetical protein
VRLYLDEAGFNLDDELLDDDTIEIEDDFDNYDDLRDQLKTISDKLGVSGKVSQKDTNDFIFSISSHVKLHVEFDNAIDDMYIKIRSGERDSESTFNCYDDTTELSNLSDEINTAIMVAKEVQDKLM